MSLQYLHSDSVLEKEVGDGVIKNFQLHHIFLLGLALQWGLEVFLNPQSILPLEYLDQRQGSF